MSRNGSGSYTLPSAVNPVVDGTTISTTWANTTLDDLATAMTDSLDRNGKGGMLAPLRGADGSAAAPAYAFTSDTNSGLYRAGADDLRLSVGGAEIARWAAGQYTISGVCSATGNFRGPVGAPDSPSYSFTTDPASGMYLAGVGDVRVSIAEADVLKVTAAGLTVTGSIIDATAANTTAATAAVPQNALVLSNGHLSLGATDPNSNVGLDNVLAAGLVCKAWANISISAGAVVTLNDGMNISSDTPPAINGGGQLDITLKAGMANTTYVPVVLPIGLVSWVPAGILSSATVVGVRAYETSGAGAAISWNDGTARQFVIAIFGRQ